MPDRPPSAIPPRELTLAQAAVCESTLRRDDPNVVAVGFGLKFRGGIPHLEAVLHYFVNEKLPDEEAIRAAGSTPVDGERHGYGTDVRVLPQAHVVKADTGLPTGERGTHKEDPLLGGTSTAVISPLGSFPFGSVPFEWGTLGGICFETANGAPMAISNAHVWGSEIGDDVIQPLVPVGAYAGAALELLLCGPAAFAIDTVLPSPLTLGLAAASAAAYAAAIASDAEDPTRWGQRVGGAPAAGATTSAEHVQLKAETPHTPFAGIAYATEATWGYLRETSAGVISQEEVQKRPNEHVLIGKRVWTQRDEYHAGERVEICAEITVAGPSQPEDWFVVATCHPNPSADPLVRRVLVPGRCAKRQQRNKETCLRGFPPPAAPDTAATFPISAPPFTVYARAPGSFSGPWPDANGGTILDLPSSSPTSVAFPPSTRVRVTLVQRARARIRVEALNSAGMVVADASTSGTDSAGETLMLEADEIVQIAITTKATKGNALAGICISQGTPSPLKPPRDTKRSYPIRLTYTGAIDLDLTTQRGDWAIMLSVQGVNNLPVGTDPAVSARLLGGITTSANIADVGGCVIVELMDHVFHVF